VYVYRLNEIEGSDGTKIEIGDLTVIVGPNNAGKSRALRDIAELTTQSSSTPNIKVVARVSTALPVNTTALFEAYPKLRGITSNNGVSLNALNHTLTNSSSVQWGGTPEQVEENWNAGIEKKDQHTISHLIGQRLTIHLLTETRLMLLNAGPNTPEDTAHSLLQQLYLEERKKEIELRETVKGVFNVELVLDFTIPSQLCLRIAEKLGDVPPDPRDARPILSQLEKLDQQGDGLRSYVGIVASLIVMNRPLCLIDEPEAFLHPPQAYALGRFIAQQSGPGKQIIIATHSADVLRGALSVKDDVAVVRVDRKSDTNTFKKLTPARLTEIIRDPLLASHRVIEGLFSAAAIVVEADADARFYQAILNKVRPNADVHFVTADNKQTVPKIASLYRELGVRTAGIVDIDALNDTKEFSKQLDALGFDSTTAGGLIADQTAINRSLTGKTSEERASALLETLNTATSDVCAAVSQSNEEGIDKSIKKADSSIRKTLDSGKPWSEAKEKGIEAFNLDARAAFQRVYGPCATAGLFINRSANSNPC
jgi:energy-coupling factor transporter ATP-binding protein EcfA2